MSDFIPEGVVLEILSRLPTKSLIRFRSVSKLWNSLITSPYFINSQLNQSLISKNSYDNLPLVLVRQCIARSSRPVTRLEHYKLFIDTGVENNTFDEYLEIPFPLKIPFHNFFYLLGYVKGLFCVSTARHKFFFWNPSIRKSISLPKPGIVKKTHGNFVETRGFGFDLLSNDYKVVRVVFLYETKPRELVAVPLVEIYSLNVGAWKVSSGAADSFPLGFILSLSHRSPACLEGAIHFAAEHRKNRSDRLICAFDLGDDVFRTISLPSGLANTHQRDPFIETIVFRGLLSLLCKDEHHHACSIWIMIDYGNIDSWYKYVKVDLTGRISRAICIRNNGHILLVEDERTWNAPTRERPTLELSSYDPGTKEIKRLGINGAKFHVDTYEENLILLNKTDAPRRGGRRTRKRKDM